VAETLVETCFCQDGLNRFKPRFKPVLAETCQPWFLTISQGCKRDLSLQDRDRDETETKTFLQFHEAETSDFCHEMRPRPCKAEIETFFQTFNFQHCAEQ